MSDRAVLAIILGVLVLFGAGMVFTLSGVDGALRWTSGDRIGILPVRGIIGDGSRELAELERLRRKGSVRGFVLEIRSPGGAVGGAQSLYRAVKRLREEDDRPVVAWIGDVGASGGYYAALAGDSVVALPGSITGSIGVIMEFPNARELFRKVGVELEVVKSGRFKDLGSPVRSLDEEEREVIRQLIGDVYDQFVDVVAEERRLSRDSVLTLADGRIFSGERATRIGLVDGTATLADALDMAGRMAGLGARPDTVYPGRRDRPELLDLFTEGGARLMHEVLRQWVGASPSDVGGSPRLLYLWR